MMSASVHMLCALTSSLCAVLLYRRYRTHRTGLLLWSAICFLALGLNNILLFVDLTLAPNMDLSVIRTLPAVLGYGALIWGFIWDYR